MHFPYLNRLEYFAFRFKANAPCHQSHHPCIHNWIPQRDARCCYQSWIHRLYFIHFRPWVATEMRKWTARWKSKNDKRNGERGNNERFIAYYSTLHMTMWSVTRWNQSSQQRWAIEAGSFLGYVAWVHDGHLPTIGNTFSCWAKMIFTIETGTIAWTEFNTHHWLSTS